MSSELTNLANGSTSPVPGSAVSDRTFRLVLYDALASEAMATLTTGVFLAGYAVELGASNAAIGMLAAVPFAVQFLQLPAVALVERLRKRRAIATWAAGIGRSLLIAAAAAPFLGSRAGIIALIVSVALYQAMAAIAGCAWNSWMRDLVPENEYGRFFGRRAAATTAVATALALVCGLLIDTWKRIAPGPCAAGLFRRVHRQRGARPVWRVAAVDHAGAADASACRAHAYSEPAGGTIPRPQLPAADGLPLVVEFRGQPRRSVLCRLPAEDARLLDDNGHCAHDGKPAQQSRGTRTVGQPHRPVQQQGCAGDFRAAVPDLHVGLDLHGDPPGCNR